MGGREGGREGVLYKRFHCNCIVVFVCLDRHLLLCCSRDDALRLIDLRQNAIVATFK